MQLARYSVLDVETTGLRRHDRIVEVAVVGLDAYGSRTCVFESILDPERNPGPTRVHGLAPSHCRGAPPFRALARQLHDLLAGTILVAHNLRFDWAALRRQFERCGVRFLHEPSGLCTAKACRTLGLPARLDTACAALDIPRCANHGARVDAEAAALLCAALKARGAFAKVGTQPLRPGLGVHRLSRALPPRPRQSLTLPTPPQGIRP